MSALHIDLPAALRSRVKARATESGFDSVEAYVQALLLADAAGGPTLDDDQLEAMLLDRLDGPFVDADEADFRQMRDNFRARLGDEPGGSAAGPQR